MRVDQRLRAWIASHPGMISGPNPDSCYAEVSYEIGGDFSNQEIRDALDRAGYLVQERTERDEKGERTVAVILLPSEPLMS